jgi:LmbE family N-acetylglucosaminyl deacetylase
VSDFGRNVPVVLGYEVWRPLKATHFVDITQFVEQKKTALACYKDRFHVIDLDLAILSLNSYRAASLLCPGSSYVEAFAQMSP